jgi:hypothetical protein
MRNGFTLMVGLVAIGMLAACMPAHTNTLVFGTTTKFGIDVAAGGPDSPAPEVTVGYKRKEAVWMPLMPNRPDDTEASLSDDIKDICGADGASDCFYQGKGTGDEVDTYSVLAVFGAKFGGKGNATDGGSVEASGGLAQYFATGLAARSLAKDGGAQLVSVQPADAEALADSRMRTARAEAELKKFYSADSYALYESGVEAGAAAAQMQTDILAHVDDGTGALDGAGKWTPLVANAALSAADRATANAAADIDAVKGLLDTDFEKEKSRITKALHSALNP